MFKKEKKKIKYSSYLGVLIFDKQLEEKLINNINVQSFLCSRPKDQ